MLAFKVLLGKLLPQHDLACCVQSYDVKSRLAEIDAYRMNLHVDDAPLNQPKDHSLHRGDQAADHLINRDIGSPGRLSTVTNSEEAGT